MCEKENAMYAYWLHAAPGVGNRTFMRLVGAAGTPEEVYRQCEKLVGDPAAGLTKRQMEGLLNHKRTFDPEREFMRLVEKQIAFVRLGQAGYPARLKEIPDPPVAVYYKGKMPAEQNVFVSVIGARECSSYGRYIAEELGRQLAESGVVVVSGLARGVDGISQKAALMHGGMSAGVLGCGVDVCYPVQNRDIYDMLLQNGAVLSEYTPGTAPSPMLFPARNRIISGMSDYLVVVEGRKKSGTLITVDMALEQGKDVYVVPGRVTDPLSAGCNELLRQGAGMITSVEEFVERVCRDEGDKKPAREAVSAGVRPRGKGEKTADPGTSDTLSPLARQVLALLDSNPQTVDGLYERLSKDGAVTLQEMLSALLQLCMEGHAEQVGGCYARTFR